MSDDDDKDPMTVSVLREALEDQKTLNAELRAKLVDRDETLEFFRRYLRFDDATIKLVNELVTAMAETSDEVSGSREGMVQMMARIGRLVLKGERNDG